MDTLFALSLKLESDIYILHEHIVSFIEISDFSPAHTSKRVEPCRVASTLFPYFADYVHQLL